MSESVCACEVPAAGFIGAVGLWSLSAIVGLGAGSGALGCTKEMPSGVQGHCGRGSNGQLGLIRHGCGGHAGISGGQHFGLGLQHRIFWQHNGLGRQGKGAGQQNTLRLHIRGLQQRGRGIQAIGQPIRHVGRGSTQQRMGLGQQIRRGLQVTQGRKGRLIAAAQQTGGGCGQQLRSGTGTV